ncbi:MAG: hypothetical protein OEV25_03795 [Deltaproteobacteria bacterium]|jgi:hypothetical protein|nr:hypothetical protein [Deltaproteobacteria bacterium]MDH3897184.1 hypothetical protein [Deltaproteobacteria bacterium]MDH3926563.1 hypothetical protein [Deltaproteobacteria bacterium]MDH3962520.1 hypothetical protein [Deltaproteobacteria bacterium]PNV85066.1 MAG: hypothetical protein C0610_13715 [Desulfobacteraceae bacterium]
MATKEETLYEKTYKDQVFELEKRVYCTLVQEGDDQKIELQIHRTQKLLSLFIKHLHDKGIFTDDDVDDFLFEIVQ